MIEKHIISNGLPLTEFDNYGVHIRNTNNNCPNDEINELTGFDKNSQLTFDESKIQTKYLSQPIDFIMTAIDDTTSTYTLDELEDVIRNLLKNH